MNSTIEQELIQHGYGLFQTIGDSMEPILRSRKSTVVIEHLREPPGKYDVVLFRRPTGQYVLHRIVKVRDRDYLICGDNRTYLEPVPKEWVIGVMTGYYPDETSTFVSCASIQYRQYLEAWGRHYCIRFFRTLPNRVVHKIFVYMQK